MFNRFLAAAAAATILTCLPAAPAAAGVTSFVSGKGVDAGDCSSPANPCRTFQFALGRTNAGGEIKALDPANYFAVTINKSISIVGVEGAGILRSTAGDAISIAAGFSDRVHVRGLSLDGFGGATHGVRVDSAGTVEIVDCVIRRFTSIGIRVSPAAGTVQLLVAGALVSNNGGAGLFVDPTGTASVNGFVERTTFASNRSGMTVQSISTSGRADMRVVDSAAEGNTQDGFRVFGPSGNAVKATLLLESVASNGNGTAGLTASNGVAQLKRSTFSNNFTGISFFSGGVVETFGDNVIRGNTPNFTGGALTAAGLR